MRRWLLLGAGPDVDNSPHLRPVTRVPRQLAKTSARARSLACTNSGGRVQAAASWRSELRPVSTEKLPDIQILRAIAIIMVLMQHLSITPTLLALFANKITLPFFAGVELFFIISGYVVTRTLFRETVEPGAFVVKRLFRLLPAIFVFLLLSLAILLFVRNVSLDSPFADQLRIEDQAYWQQSLAIILGYLINLKSAVSYYNGAMWSLSVEFQFYATVTCISAAFMVFRVSGLNQARLFFAIAAVCLALSLAERANELRGWIVWPDRLRIISYIAKWRFDFMAAGVLLALAPKVFPNFSLKSTKTSWLFISPWLLLVPLAITSLCYSPLERPDRVLNGFALPVMLVMFTGLLGLACEGLAFPGKQTRFYKALLWVGERSYTIYLLHFPMMALVWVVSAKWLPSAIFASPLNYGLSQFALVVPAVAVLSDLVFRCVEEPMRKYGAALARRLPAAPFAAAPSNIDTAGAPTIGKDDPQSVAAQ
jgi:peptidoglycan/LPS O-acetylase OafA/YrhL